MTDRTEARESRNEAAEELRDWIGSLPSGSAKPYRLLRDALAAARAEIEAECVARGHLTAQDLADMQAAARAEGLREVAQHVRLMPTWDKRSVPGGLHIHRNTLLEWIAALAEKEGGER